MDWFISDFHFNHYRVNQKGEARGIILFERTRFAGIWQHDEYIKRQLRMWACQHVGETLWVLGDFGDPAYLEFIKELRYDYFLVINFVWGNHDLSRNKLQFEQAFDNVYYTPVYLTKRVILSHEPVYPCPAGCLNVHGHLHGAVLDSKQHVNASAHIINYQPFSWKKVQKQLGTLQKANFKFLQEPYADKYIFTQPKDDAVYDKKTGKIDLKASLAKRKV